MNSAIATRIIVDSIVFHGMNEDDTIDPDTAVKLIESIAANLKKMTSIVIREFLNNVDAIANIEAQACADPRSIDFIRNIGSNLGLTD